MKVNNWVRNHIIMLLLISCNPMESKPKHAQSNERAEKIKIIESNRQAFDAYCQFVKQVVNDRPKPVESLSLLGALIKEQNSKILSQALMHLNKVPVEAKYSELLRIAQRATLNSQWKCLAYQEYIKLGY